MIWHVIYTNSQSEATADQYLRRAGYETLFLRYRGSVSHAGRKTVKILPVYPRYLFLALDPAQGLYRASKCQGVCKIVTFGEGLAEIPPEIIEKERRRIGMDGLVKLTPEQRKLRKRLERDAKVRAYISDSTGTLTEIVGAVILDSGSAVSAWVNGKRVRFPAHAVEASG